MTSAHMYPTLRLGLLQSIVQLKADFDRDPDYLRDPACPYDPETVDLLEKLFEARVIETVVEKKVLASDGGGRRGPRDKKGLSAEDQAEVEAELADLLNQMRSLGKDLDGEEDKKLDTATKISIMKTKATLIENLVKMRERIFNVKQMSTFQSVVISILDDLVPEDGRAVFLTRLEPYRD